MKLELTVVFVSVSMYLLLKLISLWFVEGESRKRQVMRFASVSVRLVGIAFGMWGLYIVFNAMKLPGRLEMLATAGYGLIQLGFAIFLVSFPRILQRGSLADTADALGDAVNRNV
ncbi:MAG: hypothetical protein IPH30_08755 [Betaproteobacteria bacterium]|nr:hypothetical protein [Betaproteobacteria bacterium]